MIQYVSFQFRQLSDRCVPKRRGALLREVRLQPAKVPGIGRKCDGDENKLTLKMQDEGSRLPDNHRLLRKRRLRHGLEVWKDFGAYYQPNVELKGSRKKLPIINLADSSLSYHITHPPPLQIVKVTHRPPFSVFPSTEDRPLQLYYAYTNSKQIQ